MPASSSSSPGRTSQRSKTSANCSSIQAEVITSGASTASTETTPTFACRWLWFPLTSSYPSVVVPGRKEARSGLFQAERAGFEPAKHLSALTRFPVALLRPLGHLSVAAKAYRQLDYLPATVETYVATSWIC